MTKERFKELLYPGMIILLPVVFFGRILFTGSMLFGTDWLAGEYMQRQYFWEMIHKGIFPLWNMMKFAGIPTGEGFFGDIFYPLTLALKYIMPLYAVWTMTFIMHTAIAGLGTYWFLKDRIKENLVSFIFALSYMFTGIIISEVYGGHDGRVIVMSYLPLLLFFLNRGIFSGRLFYFGAAGAVSGLMLLSGHIQSSYYAVMFGLFFAAYMHIDGHYKSKFRNYTIPASIAAGFIFSLIHRYLGFAVLIGCIIAIPAFLDRKFRTESASLYLKLAFFALITGMISAVQYIPVFRFLPEAARGLARDYAYATSWSMGPADIVDWFFSGFSGVNVGAVNTYWGENPFKLHTTYPGAAAAVLAAAMLFVRKKKAIMNFFSAALIITVIAALGKNTPFYHLIYSLFPYIDKFRAPELIIFTSLFSMNVMAAHFIDEGGNERVFRISAGIISAAGLILIIFPGIFTSLFTPYIHSMGLPANAAAQKIALMKKALDGAKTGAIITLLTAGIIYAALYIKGFRKKTVLAVLALLILTDLWMNGWKFVRGVGSPEKYFSQDEVVSVLKEDKGLFRVFPLGYRSDDYLSLFGIESVSGNHPSPFADYQKFINNPSSVMFAPEKLISVPERLKFLNVKYIVSPYIPEDTSGYDERSQEIISTYNSMFVKMGFERFRNAGKFMVLKSTDCLPRIYCRTEYYVEPSTDKVLEMIDSGTFDAEKYVVLSRTPGFESSDGGDSAAYDIKSIDYGPNRVKIEMSSQSDAVLVLADQYYKAFKCTVDGRRADVLKANGIFRGVAVKEGSHVIEFYYDPSLQIFSLLISLIGFAIIIFIWILDRKKKYEDTGNNTDIQ